MRNTAIQMILILHDSSVLWKVHILDHELYHFSCPVLLHDLNVGFIHKISCCQMQCITKKFLFYQKIIETVLLW